MSQATKSSHSSRVSHGEALAEHQRLSAAAERGTPGSKELGVSRAASRRTDGEEDGWGGVNRSSP